MSGPQPEIYKIFCIILRDDTPFGIDIENSKTVDDLKKLVHTEKQNRLPPNTRTSSKVSTSYQNDRVIIFTTNRDYHYLNDRYSSHSVSSLAEFSFTTFKGEG
jgi:Crinkler effector protein N-terminal domain